MADGFLIKNSTIAALELSRAYHSPFNEQHFLKDVQKDIN
jgi:hypothetical protein